MEQKISGCICSQQAQLPLLPAQAAADPAGRGENESASSLAAAPGPGQASPPLGGGGLGAGEGKELGKQRLPEKGTRQRQKGSCSQLKGINPGKKHLPPHNTWLPLPRRPDSALNPTDSSCPAGVGSSAAPQTSPGSRAGSFPWSKGRVHKAKGVGASGSAPGEGPGPSGAGEIPTPALLSAVGRDTALGDIHRNQFISLPSGL